MSHDTDTLAPEPRTGTRGRNPLTWLVAAAAAVVIGGVGIYALTNGPGATEEDAPPVADSEDQVVITQLRAPAAAGVGRCMVPTAEVLANQETAFSGTVDEITDGTVTLTPTTYYAGEQADKVEVAASTPEMTALIGAVDFQVGETYLVSANGGQVTVCGFSGPATPQLQRLYDDAFGR